MAKVKIVSDRLNTFFTNNKIATGTAAPTSGTWVVGDIVISTIQSGVIGWVCTVAGTPGTWKTIQTKEDLSTIFAAKSHGNHVPTTQTADARKFLRNDNTWQSLPSASTSATGIVQLNNTVTSTSTTQAATANAVKLAYDKANEAFQSASDGKTKIATAITGKGVTASSSDTFDVLSTKIGQIKKAEGNAVAADVLSGKTFTNANGGIITGTMVNRSAITAASSVGSSGTTKYFRIPQGAYLTNASTGYPEISATATQIDANIKAANIVSGVSICGVAGSAIKSTLPSWAGDFWFKGTGPSNYSMVGCCECGGKLYAIGGTGTYTSNNCYDPVNNSWTAKADMPTGRTIVRPASCGGKVYVIGGYNNGTRYNINQCYDPSTNTWSNKTNITNAANYWTVVIGTALHCVGIDKNYHRSYDTTTDTWTAKAVRTTGRYNAGVCVAANKIYCLGGDYGSSSTYDDNVCYDPSTNTWTNKKVMNYSRRNLAAIGVGNYVYAIGGYASTPVSHVERYNVNDNTWSTLQRVPTGIDDLTVSNLNGVLYCIEASTCWCYKP